MHETATALQTSNHSDTYVRKKAAGTLVVGGGVSNVEHQFEVTLGELPTGLTVVVEAAGRSVEVQVGEAALGSTFML